MRAPFKLYRIKDYRRAFYVVLFGSLTTAGIAIATAKHACAQADFIKAAQDVDRTLLLGKHALAENECQIAGSLERAYTRLRRQNVNPNELALNRVAMLIAYRLHFDDLVRTGKAEWCGKFEKDMRANE